MRAAGFSVRVLRPGPEATVQPPGQGRLLLALRGRARVREHADPGSKVLETARPDRGQELVEGGPLFAVANDARWSLEGEAEAVILSVGTSVPRAGRRAIPVAVRRAPRLLFENEALRVELLAPRGLWPRPRRSAGPEHLVALRAGLVVDGVELAPGSLLSLPAGQRRLTPKRWRGGRLLVLSSSLERRSAERLDRGAARGFTPFRR